MGVWAAPELKIATTPELGIARKIEVCNNVGNISFCTIGSHVRDDGVKPLSNLSELRCGSFWLYQKAGQIHNSVIDFEVGFFVRASLRRNIHLENICGIIYLSLIHISEPTRPY